MLMTMEAPKFPSRWSYCYKEGVKYVSTPTSDDYSVWKVDHLQKECTARGFQLERSVSKEDRMKRLQAYDEMKEKLEEEGIVDDSLNAEDIVVGTVRTKHCLFRLLNVLFHDKHITQFMLLGDSLTKYDLDTRRVGLDHKSVFWNAIHADFVDDLSIEYDMVMSDEDHVAFEYIEPETIVKHSIVKLEDMWKDVNRRYRKAKINFTKSGEGDSDFWNFCNGQADVFYLYTLLQTNQEAISFVDGGMLPDN